MENEKKLFELDWKVPSDNKMADFMEKQSEEMQIEFANECCTLDEKGEPKINKKNARDWLVNHFDGKNDEEGNPMITWKNRPAKKDRPLSGAKRIAQWLKK